ncbi:MAG: MFS transporter [Inquilinaceae bacterium]
MHEVRAVLLAVVPLMVSAAIMIVGNGLFGTLLSVRMNLDAVPLGQIGGILALYSVGFVVGTLTISGVVEKVGHIRAFAAMAAIASASALVHALYVEPLIWAVLRAITGFCMAGLYTIIESWLNAKSPNAVRGRVMSAYMAVNYLSYGSAQLLLTVMNPRGFELFALVAILISLSLVPLSLSKVETPQTVYRRRLPLTRLIAISPLGVAGCFAAGLINSAFNSMAPIYAITVRGTADAVAQLMVTAILAGFLLQFPMGRLSDHFDRRRVILTLALVMTAVSLSVASLSGPPWWVVLCLAALFGGLIYTLYPISLSHANDFLDQGDLVPAAAGLLLCFGVGASLGPIIAAQAMTSFGVAGFFFYIAAISASLSVFVVYRMTRRPAIPNEAQGPFVAVPQTTALAVDLDPRAGDGPAEPDVEAQRMA